MTDYKDYWPKQFRHGLALLLAVACAPLAMAVFFVLAAKIEPVAPWLIALTVLVVVYRLVFRRWRR